MSSKNRIKGRAGRVERDSMTKTVESFKDYVETALTVPHMAGQMAYDERLPWWLRRLAESLKVESADDLRPSFRKTVESWINDPDEARHWASFADGKLPRWAVETARVLGARQLGSE